ncbi:MAG: STAS domain-containing protein [Actinomycetota bacterium]
MAGLSANLEIVDGATIVGVAGELDIASAPIFEARIAEAEALHPALLVLDLRQLTFMDSTGLRIVLAADSSARRDVRRFAVIRGPDPVHRVFLIALLDRRLDLVNDLSEALAIGGAAP